MRAAKLQSKQNSREGTLYEVRSRTKAGATHWHPIIQRLLQQGHTFLPCDFTDGYLFRGVSQSLLASLTSNEFGYFDDARSLPTLERELGVFFISHTLSDALAVARLWEKTNDAGVLVVRSELFSRELAQRRAAVLGFAEGGLVFKYPFFVRPLRVSDIDYLLVAPDLRSRMTGSAKSPPMMKPTVLAPTIDADADDRVRFNQTILNVLQQRRIQGAALVSTDIVPRAG